MSAFYRYGLRSNIWYAFDGRSVRLERGRQKGNRNETYGPSDYLQGGLKQTEN